MKQYLISIFEPAGGAPEPEFLARVMRDLDQIRAELEAAGSWVFAGGLHEPETATVLRLADDGGVLTVDGPFAEGKEHLGGFTVITAPDLDAALGWGRRYAQATTLPIEVRPFRGDVDG
jgi:hypothetical protein